MAHTADRLALEVYDARSWPRPDSVAYSNCVHLYWGFCDAARALAGPAGAGAGLEFDRWARPAFCRFAWERLGLLFDRAAREGATAGDADAPVDPGLAHSPVMRGGAGHANCPNSVRMFWAFCDAAANNAAGGLPRPDGEFEALARGAFAVFAWRYFQLRFD